MAKASKTEGQEVLENIFSAVEYDNEYTRLKYDGEGLAVLELESGNVYILSAKPGTLEVK